MKGRLTFIALVALALAGCNQESKTTPEVKSGAPEPVKVEEPVVPSGPKLTDVSTALRHDGFEYYGLGNEKPQKMKLNQGGTVVEGEQAFQLDSVTADTAVFKQVWSGGLPAADSKVEVTSKGIFGIEAKGTKINPPQMELPAKPIAGMMWKSDAKIEVDGSTISNSTGKIVGVQTIKVGTRSIQALVVKRTSQISSGTIKQTMATTEYYEKGVGAVKLDVTMSGGGQPARSFSMEAIP